jgi:hypothetical protein
MSAQIGHSQILLRVVTPARYVDLFYPDAELGQK